MNKNGEGSAEVAQLRPSQTPPPQPQPTRAKGLHGVAISAMSVSALLGIGLMFALITVNWTDSSRRIVVVALVLVIVGFMVSASIAVFAAARDTHRRSPGADIE